MSAPVCVDGRYLRDDFPGVGRYVFELVAALAAGEGLEIALLHDPEAPNRRFALDSLPESIRLVATPGDPRSPVANRRLTATLQRLRPRLFHAPFFLGPLRSPAPRVVTIHDLIPVRFPETVPSRLHRLLLPIALRLAIRSAELVITPSRATSNDLSAWIGSRKAPVVVIPEAAGDQFRPAPTEKVAELRRRLGLEGPYAFCLASRRPHKNVAALERAWRMIGDERRGWALVLAGGPGEPSPAEPGDDEAIRRLGGVTEGDLAALYSGAELFVTPSLTEGFGLTVLEAMACGTAVACSAAGAIPEVAGDAAALFEPTDEASIARTVAALLASAERRQRLATAGLERSAAFSWRRTARLTAEAYARVAQP